MKYFISFCFLFLSSLTFADQLIIEPDMGRRPILNAIQQSGSALNLIMYGFTDQALLNAFLQQKLKNRTIKIILEGRPYKRETENMKTIAALNQSNIAWHANIPGMRLIHQKSLIIDHRQAMIMTFNFTRSAFKNDRNFALIIDDTRKVKQIEAVFSADWNHQPSDSQADDVLYSPDNSRRQLLDKISQTKKTLDIYAQNINDYQLIGALAKAARHGVTVNVLTSNKLHKKQIHFLKKSGINVRYSRHYYIHAKVMIFDKQKALLGSINLTRASLDNNRELSVITSDSNVIKQLNTTFDLDWQRQ